MNKMFCLTELDLILDYHTKLQDASNLLGEEGATAVEEWFLAQ